MQLNGIYQDSTTQVGDPWVWDGIIRSALAEGPKVSADAAMPPFAQPTWHHGTKKNRPRTMALVLCEYPTMEISSQLDGDIEISPIIRWVIGLVSRIFMEPFQVWDITCFSGG